MKDGGGDVTEEPVLSLVYDRGELEASMTAMQRFCVFELRKELEHHFRQMAEDPEGFNGTFVLPLPECNDPKTMAELDSLVREKAREAFHYKGGGLEFGGRSVDPVVIGSDHAFVYVSVGYRPVRELVVTSGGDFKETVKTHPVYGGVYLISGEDFPLFEDKNSAFDGKTAFEIRDDLAREHGDESQIVADIDEIVHCLRQILYGREATHVQRRSDLLQLARLRLKTGAAARAIISDFLDEFRSHMQLEDFGEEDDDLVLEDGSFSELLGGLPLRFHKILLRLWKLT